MKGDVIVIEPHHHDAAKHIVDSILEKIRCAENRYTISVAGESGSGKSETANAIAVALNQVGIKTVVLGQDDYFEMPPKSNDAMRREDPSWLGPHLEVKMSELESHLIQAIRGAESLTKPIIDYHRNSITSEELDLKGVSVVIVEGTYTSLLKNINTRVFINRNRIETELHRKKRNRGTEFGDPFIEEILETEHKIIAGHKQLADFIIQKDYTVDVIGKEIGS